MRRRRWGPARRPGEAGGAPWGQRAPVPRSAIYRTPIPSHGALAQVSVDLPRCAGADIRPSPHGPGAFEPLPGGHHGAGGAGPRGARPCHDAPVPPSDRLLMGPGPSNPYPAVTMALAGPILGHLDPEFLSLLDGTNDRLRQVFATSNALTLPVSGTGSAGMEAAFVNFVRPGDPVGVGANGVFGARMCE